MNGNILEELEAMRRRQINMINAEFDRLRQKIEQYVQMPEAETKEQSFFLLCRCEEALRHSKEKSRWRLNSRLIR